MQLRVVAFVVGVALVFTQLLTALHELVEPHEICPEHGYLVHVSVEPSFRLTRSADGRAGLSALPNPERSHEHCVLAARAGDEPSLAPSSPPSITAGTAPLRPATPRCTASAYVASAPLVRAPKQSPPSA